MKWRRFCRMLEYWQEVWVNLLEQYERKFRNFEKINWFSEIEINILSMWVSSINISKYCRGFIVYDVTDWVLICKLLVSILSFNLAIFLIYLFEKMLSFFMEKENGVKCDVNFVFLRKWSVSSLPNCCPDNKFSSEVWW